MGSHRRTKSIKNRRARKIAKRISQPGRYHQWCPSVLGMKYDDNCNPILPDYYERRDDDDNTRRCRDVMMNMLSNGCEFCGYMDDLTFHHVELKRFNVADMVRHNPLLLMEELIKCKVLCQPCHSWVHAVEKRMMIKEN